MAPSVTVAPSVTLTSVVKADAADASSFRWESFAPETLCRLILQQIPRFASRPYLADEHALELALRDGLERRLVGDFCWSLCFTAEFIAALCFEGFLPICCDLSVGSGSALHVLLPKLHTQRCILRFPDLHVSKKTRRRAKSYRLTVCQAFGEVVSGCLKQHGESSWLHAPLRDSFASLASSFAPATTPAVSSSTESASKSRGLGHGAASARLVSFELWRDGQLLAGEIGSVAGCSYTSFTGFYAVDGAGAVQLALTAKVLELAGFAFWDLGQEHAYKLSLGGMLVPRAGFLADFRVERMRENSLVELVSQEERGVFHGDALLHRHRTEAHGTGSKTHGTEASVNPRPSCVACGA